MTKSVSSNYLDPAALLRIRSLELRARLVMEGFIKGMHRSPHHGFSAEFSEYRAYVKGDDLRFMDWKVAARSDRWYVKKFEEETNLRCQLLLDASASMTYGSAAYTKLDYAATLAATVALFLMQQGDAVGLTLLDETVLDHVPAKLRAGQLPALLTPLQRASASPPLQSKAKTSSFATALQQASALVRRKAMLVLLSDFLMPLEGIESQLGLFRAMGHEVLVLQTLDAAEVDFNFAKGGFFEDIENGQRLLLDPVKMRSRYLSKMNAHQESLRALCARQQADYRLVRTDMPLESLLFEFISVRQRLASPQRVRRSTSKAAA
jgi:uncharacterized protein (DUF58 family)